jgi:hypothetical protein
VDGGRPGAMANSSSSTSDEGEKGSQFGALAATAGGEVFAFVRGDGEKKGEGGGGCGLMNMNECQFLG